MLNIGLKRLDTPGSFRHFNKGYNFVTSCLLSFLKEVKS